MRSGGHGRKGGVGGPRFRVRGRRPAYSRAVRKDPNELRKRDLDVLVVGGGIQGAAMARELALRGSAVALIERNDFGQGTSMRSSRLVHGGLRYLRGGNIGLVREALRERERLLRLAPHLVRPLPMVLPFFPGTGVPPWQLRLGVRLYGWLAGRSTLPPPVKLDPGAAAAAFPGLRTDGLRGGLRYFDAATRDLPLVLEVLADAAAAGAHTCNHVELLGREGDELRLRDRVGGSELTVRARHVINAAGPHVDDVRRRLGLEGNPLVRTTRGSHLVLPPRQSETALAAFLPDGRIQFVIPHPDGTLCGTTDVDEAADSDTPTVPGEDVEYVLGALRWLLARPVERADVRFAYAGWRSLPLAKGPAGALNREAFTVEEPLGGATTVHSVVGGKLTTHRSFAERTVARLAGLRGPWPTRDRPLPGATGPQEPSDPLWQRHGSTAAAVRRLCRERPEWGEPIGPGRPFLAAEAVFALRERGAVTFADLALRRLYHSQGPLLDDAWLRPLFALYRTEARWPVDDDYDRARAALAGEVERMSGGLAAGAGA